MLVKYRFLFLSVLFCLCVKLLISAFIGIGLLRNASYRVSRKRIHYLRATRVRRSTFFCRFYSLLFPIKTTLAFRTHGCNVNSTPFAPKIVSYICYHIPARNNFILILWFSFLSLFCSYKNTYEILVCVCVWFACFSIIILQIHCSNVHSLTLSHDPCWRDS